MKERKISSHSSGANKGQSQIKMFSKSSTRAACHGTEADGGLETDQFLQPISSLKLHQTQNPQSCASQSQILGLQILGAAGSHGMD